MRINTNLTALNTFNSYTAANNKIASSVAKLSSGYAINSAADNAAGLAISEKMRAQIRGLDKASSNSQDAISLVQTAEGSLKSADEILQRMREISVQSSSDTNEDAIDRDALQAEFAQLQSELDEISSDASFNNQKLLDGSLSSSKTNATIATTAKGLTTSVGNAKAGSYNFNVSVKTTSDAVEGSAADTIAVSNSSVSDYFSGVSTNAANTKVNSDEKSDLLNGNYEITGATVGDDGTITVTAKGDNDQVFTAELKSDAYDDETSYTLDFGDDAFTITFNKDTALGTDPTDSEVNKLASAFVGTAFTVSGGEAPKSAEKAVYASLTGAKDVKLEVGMDSVTFDNGVTVNFDKLTASDLDTTEKSAGLAFKAGTTYDATTANTNGFTLTAAEGVKGQEYTFYADSALDADGKVTLHAVGADGKTYTATSDIAYDATNAKAYNFNFEGLGAVKVTGAATTPYDTGAAPGSTLFSGTIKPYVTSNAILTHTSVALASDATTTTVPNQTYTATGAANNATTATNCDITVEGDDGKTYTATIAYASMTNGAEISLDFKDENDKTAFTVTTTLGGAMADAAAATAGFVTTKPMTFTLGGLDKNTDEVFGADPSTITVESSKNDGLTIQVGANTGDELEINLERADAEYLGVNGLDVSTQTGASKAIDVVNKAISQVSSQRAYLGAIQNRLDYKIANLETSSQNLTSAESAIRDVDMASEMTKFTNANILSQAATAMLAQANSLPQNVLSLLG